MQGNRYPFSPNISIEKKTEYLELYEELYVTNDLPEMRFIALRDAIELCACHCVPPPKWLADAVTQLCYARIISDRRPGRLGSYYARLRQHRIDLIRWASVRHLRDNCRDRVRTWHDAYATASFELRTTIAQGSEEVMAASYKRHNKQSYLKLLKMSGGAEAVASSAQFYFEEREQLLDVDRLFRD